MAETVTSPAPAGVRGSLIRSGALSLAALVALGLTRLVHGSLVSRATDRETYGLVGLLIAVATIASLLLPAGVASAASRYIPFHHGRQDPDTARAVHRFLLRTSAAGALVLATGSALGAMFLLGLGAADTLQAGALCLTFSLYSVQKSTLYAFGEVSAYVRLELTSSVLAVTTTVLIVVGGSRLYLLPLVAGYALFSTGAWWRLRPQTAGAGRLRTGRREIVGYVVLACLGTVSSMGFLQGTQLLANHFAARTEVAYFAAAVVLVAPAYFLPRALSLVLFPAMARSHGAGDLAQVRRNADLSTRALVLVLAPVFVGGVLLAPDLLAVFGGARYAAGGQVLRLLLGATYLAVIQVAAVNTLSSGALVRVPVGFAVFGCLTGLGVVAVLGGPLGATGIGLGYLLGTAVTALGPIVSVWRRHRMPWAGPLARSLGCVAAALLAGQVLDWTWLVAGPRPLVDVPAALVAALLVLAVLRGDLALLRYQARQAGP